MSATSRKWHQSQAENRKYQAGYEAGFERGTHAGVAGDRLSYFALGALLGACLALLIKAFT